MGTKAKEPVKVRRRALKDGNISLFLETYQNGQKKYEWLHLYLIPEKDKEAKKRNEVTLRAAETIKAQRIIDMTNARAGIVDTRTAGKIMFFELVDAFKRKKARRGQQTAEVNSFYRHFRLSKLSEKTRLSNVDKDFCLQFLRYLKEESGLKPQSQKSYQTIFNSMLNDAERNGLIAKNPMRSIESDDKIQAEQVHRDFLTAEEVKTLIDTPPIGRLYMKQIFLFSCFCGLRISDIRALKWGDIITEDGNTFARITQKKTKVPLILPLSTEALKWLPVRKEGDGDDKNIFPPVLTANIDKSLKIWGGRAGIKKQLSIHLARHTFATLLITSGTDIYVVSKLLGHKKITTTQIYAEVVDVKKTQAVEALSKLF